MKCTFYIVFFLFCANILFAQETTLLVNNNEKSILEVNFSKIKEAFSLSNKGKGNEALGLSLEILEYAKQVNNDSLIAFANVAMGTAQYALKNYNDAILKTKEAKGRFSRLNNQSLVILCDNNIGVFYRELGSIDSSNVYFEKALKTAVKIGGKKQQLQPNYNLGNNYSYYHKDYNKGLVYLKEALRLIKNASDNRIEGDVYVSLGKTYHGLNNFKLAHYFYDKGIDHAKSNEYLETLFEAYQSKVDLYQDENNQEMVNFSLHELIKVKDSIWGVTKIDLEKKIEAKYRLKENKSKIKFIEKEKIAQDELLERSKIFNMFLVMLMTILIFTAHWIYVKNKELKIAKDRAEKLSEVKSSFYSEISHELRTPLYAVIELSGLLLKENVNVKNREYLESLKFSGNHLLSLINNVLQLNKVESGKMQLQHLNFNLKELITNIIDSLEYGLRDSGNKIILNYDYNIPTGLVGDSLKLSQIFINLISNAIKFTNNGNIEITIKEIKRINKEDEIKIFFSVKDDGIGIPIDKQDKVFEDFYQELAKNENSYKGTGLGLSIVKRTLDAMNSTIQIESEEGKGTAFFFEIIFRKQCIDNCSDNTLADELSFIRNCNILIVDDNKINQLVTKKVLDQLEIQSSVVGSGKEAIAIVKEQYFDCILMDLHMPELDGYETTKRIREFNKEISIVALTAASSEEVEKKINNYEMDGYVLKPFVLSNFITTITRAINKKEKYYCSMRTLVGTNFV